RSKDSGWVILWNCDSCGYLKQATEQNRVFMRGCDKYEITMEDGSLRLRNLASSIRMSLGGIEKMKQVYGNGKAEMLPWAKLDAQSGTVETDELQERKRTCQSWDFLVETLLLLQSYLTEDEKHCFISINEKHKRAKDEIKNKWGTLHI
ncbi:hypothetical protein PENTCL1PPCAC_12260, partial [Pristionchus entomophagus]